MKKSILIGMIAATVVLGLTACGTNDDSKDSSTKAPTKESTAEPTKDAEDKATIEPTMTPKVDESEWKKAYSDYVTAMDNNNQYTYDFIYVDEGDVPEVFCYGTCSAADMKLLSYNDGEVVDNPIAFGTLYYIEKQNKMYVSSGKMDYYNDDIYHLEDGTLTKDIGGTYKLIGSAALDDVNGDELPYLYTWNDVDMTKEEYEKALGDTFDQTAAKTAEATQELETFTNSLK